MLDFVLHRLNKNGGIQLLVIAVLNTALLGVHSSAFAANPVLQAPGAKSSTDWPVYGGEDAEDHYSPLTQINRKNVDKLRMAWTYDTGERGGMETNPIIIGDVLYTYTPGQKVIALNATSGRLIWKFDSGIGHREPDRGVTYWTDGKESRILAGVGHFLYALDAKTGKLIPSFGEDGRIDLRKGLDCDSYKEQWYSLSSPGMIYKNLIIVGGSLPETHPALRGDIRAFDVRTGALRWTFHTIPHPGEFGYDTWPKGAWKNAGSANNWAGMTVDAKAGIVYVPTGSAVADFYGGDRVGNDLFSDTLLALNASTGKLIWYFQGVHHDLWDQDFPAPPALFTIRRNGKNIDAIAQTTKQGYLYLFNRTTGHPLFPVVESSYPASTMPGEVTSPTQPHPILPLPYSRQLLTADMLTNRTPEAHAWAVNKFKTFQNGGLFFPYSMGKINVMLPGASGGEEWGGPAINPETGIIYINAIEMAWIGGFTPPHPGESVGEKIYQAQCSVCHGQDRAGSPPTFPSLVDIGDRLSETQIEKTIRQGRGRMPSFNNIDDHHIRALIRYLETGGRNGDLVKTSANYPEAHHSKKITSVANENQAFEFTGFGKFLDPEGYPAIAPPWGTLNAIDLKTGKYLWKIPFGEYPELAAKGMSHTGTESYGGPIVTAGGLVFIGATVFDQKFHAFDSQTGKLLWETKLPFSGLATPATYMVNGKQYVVIASGGGQSSKKPTGGLYIAFALP